MFGKIIISCELNVVTGLHIGAGSAFSAIGAVDAPVVRDSYTGKPVIPGSSLKGKLRYLLSQVANKTAARKCDDDAPEIKRLFGASNPIMRSRLQFADAFVVNEDQFSETGLTEIKYENGIDRATSIANPRQIERVNKGVAFGVRIVYNMEADEAEVMQDLSNLARAMKLLEIDYLGGHGSRGSGRVSFRSFDIKEVETDNLDCSKAMELFKEVEDYELLPS